jgi:hypothetical protein
MDVALILEQLDDAKQLVQSAMAELKSLRARGSAGGAVEELP